TGVISEIDVIASPAVLIPRSDESLPAPGPLTKTSADLSPKPTIRFTTSSTAMLAAYGVDLRVPLYPFAPALLQPRVSPLSLVTVTEVLLKVEVINTLP